MITCEQREELKAQLKVAFERWYGLKDIPGKTREAKGAEKKVHARIRRPIALHTASALHFLEFMF
jgi:hypothetical protein